MDNNEKQIPLLLTKHEVARIVGFHHESLARLARQGQFPKPLQISSAKNSPSRWLRSEVEAFLLVRAACRGSKPAA